MPKFKAKMKYIDVREIVIDAEDMEEARRKFDSGDWESEDTVDFYSQELVRNLAESSE